MTFVDPRDFDVVTLIDLMREFYASERLPFDEARTRRTVADLVGAPNLGLIRVVAIDSAPAGYFVLTFGFSLEFGGRLAWLDELYVRAAFRRRGVAREILQFAADLCRDRGMEALRLEVSRENAAAEALYRRVGFENPERDILTLRVRQD